MTTAPYYADESVTLYLGDCLDHPEWWTGADVLVTDPPYGRDWRSRSGMTNACGRGRGRPHGGIANDKDTTTRDRALAAWGDRPAVVFGDLLITPPAGVVQALIYAKPLDAGIKGARAGFRRDAEAMYLVGPWPAGVGGRSSIIHTSGLVAGPRGVATRAEHPHAKPLDVLEQILAACPEGVIADPFTGSGSTLIVAAYLGRRAVGVEVEERYCEIAARRLSQGALGLNGASA